MPRVVALVLLVGLLAMATGAPASAQEPCKFVLGFAALREAIGPQKVGSCLEDEHFNLENGNAEQRTSGGLMVWRKVDNFTAFTDGGTSWINGPNGLQSRPNAERFSWEKDPVQTTAAPPVPAQQSAAAPLPATPAATPRAVAPAPTPTAAPTSAPRAAAGSSFGTGTKVVGTDVKPGTYRSNNSGSGCYWERLSGFGGTTGDIIANDNARGPAVVTIKSSDTAFRSNRCAEWVEVSGPITSAPDAQFGDGTWIVGVDIAPGTWRTEGSEGCYWERQSEFGGSGAGAIIANDNARGTAVVTIKATDKGFKSSRCGTWRKSG